MEESWNFRWYWEDEPERIHQRFCDFCTTNNTWWSTTYPLDAPIEDIRWADFWNSK